MPRVSSRLDLLYLVAREFNAGLEDSEQALYNVLSATVASVAASDASLYLFDKNGDLEISLLISDFEVLKPGLDDLRVHSEQGLVGWVREHREGAVIADTNHDTRWYEADANLPEFRQASSAICVPIQLRDQLIGAND